jgi:hypothetical protein
LVQDGNNPETAEPEDSKDTAEEVLDFIRSRPIRVRNYKDAKKLSEALRILEETVEDNKKQ